MSSGVTDQENMKALMQTMREELQEEEADFIVLYQRELAIVAVDHPLGGAYVANVLRTMLISFSSGEFKTDPDEAVRKIVVLWDMAIELAQSIKENLH